MIAPMLAGLMTSAAAKPAAGGLTVAAQLEMARTAEVRPLAPYTYLLLLRYVVVNLVALALLGAAHLQGWLAIVLTADSTRLVLVIAALFLAGWLLCGAQVWRTSWELNQAHADRPHPASRAARYLAAMYVGGGAESRSLKAAALRAKLAARIAIVRQIASTLVLLGLIGTVVGFIIALSGVRPEAASDAATVAPMVASLIAGMAVALYTTLVGAVLNIWLMVNYRMLATGNVNLLAAIVERGEADVGN